MSTLLSVQPSMSSAQDVHTEVGSHTNEHMGTSTASSHGHGMYIIQWSAPCSVQLVTMVVISSH